MGMDSQLNMLLKVTPEAEYFSEDYYQCLYNKKLMEHLKICKEMSELTIDDVFPRDAFLNFSFVSPEGEFIDAKTSLPEEEFYKTQQEILRLEQEARDKFVPFIYDERHNSREFKERIDSIITRFSEHLPKDILNDVADIRVLALEEASKSIYSRISEFCAKKEEECCNISDTYQKYYNSIENFIPDKIKLNYGFHDREIKTLEQQGKDVVMELGCEGSHSNINKVVFHNATILELEESKGSRWVYNEIYLVKEGFEFHVLVQNDVKSSYITIAAEDVDFFGRNQKGEDTNNANNEWVRMDF